MQELVLRDQGARRSTGLRRRFPLDDGRRAFTTSRLRELGITWAELRDQAPKPVFRQKPAAGQFVTASGKAELRSSVLETLVRPSPPLSRTADPGADDHPGAYPYLLFAGLRERKSYNTCLHQIESLRRRESEAAASSIHFRRGCRRYNRGPFRCEVETAYGISLMAHPDDA